MVVPTPEGVAVVVGLVCATYKKRGGGSIVNQSSLGAFPAESVYGITKAPRRRPS